MQLHYSIFKEPIKIPKITITEVKVEPGLKEENEKTASFFRSSSLMGKDCCESELPHDLSPLELIATVANGLSSLPEGRGQKRNADAAELYDDDTPNSNEIQIQKSIEHAIEMCSNSSNQEKQSKETTETNALPEVKPLSAVKIENDIHRVPFTQNDTVVNKTKVAENIDVVQNEKPKKTDTASQCDPRPRKGDNKMLNSNSVHSKTYSKQVKHAKQHNSGESSLAKTAKEGSAISDVDKTNKAVSETDKKLSINSKTTDNKNSVPEKHTKASPHKHEKKLVPQKSEKVAVNQKSENVIVQKPPGPQINGLCSANDLEKEKMTKTNT